MYVHLFVTEKNSFSGLATGLEPDKPQVHFPGNMRVKTNS